MQHQVAKVVPNKLITSPWHGGKLITLAHIVLGLVRHAEKWEFVSQAALEWLSVAHSTKCRDAYIFLCCVSSLLDSDVAGSKSTLYALRET